MNGLRFLALLSSALVAAILLATCSSNGLPTSPQIDVPRLLVVTTSYPLEYLAQRVGGERVRVENLTPLGAEPHDWEPTPRDIGSLQDSDLFLYIGSGFEPWVGRATNEIEMGKVHILSATSALSPLLHTPDSEGPVDPHLWLDPGLYSRLAASVKDALVALEPSGAPEYEANLVLFQAELEALEREIEQTLRGCRSDRLVVNHAAFGYLARRLGLVQLPISGPSPEVEPSPARLRDLARQMDELGVHYVFSETLVTPRVAETLAREAGAQVLPLNPVEGLTAEESARGEDYFTIMRINLENLRIGLECP